MPFYQRVKDSVQDKGYQDIDGGSCKISVKDLKETFEVSKKEIYTKPFSYTSQAVVPEEDKLLIKKAYLLLNVFPDKLTDLNGTKSLVTIPTCSQ